jgi:hypothetical protein
LNLCELQEVASMLGVDADLDNVDPDKQQALDVLAARVHAAEAGEKYEAPVGWGTQITEQELAAFNKPKPVLMGFDDLERLGLSASSPSEPQPIG